MESIQRLNTNVALGASRDRPQLEIQLSQLNEALARQECINARLSSALQRLNPTPTEASLPPKANEIDNGHMNRFDALSRSLNELQAETFNLLEILDSLV